MRPKGMEDLAAFSPRELKRAAAEERDEHFSAEGQCDSFLKVEGRGTLVGAKDRRERHR